MKFPGGHAASRGIFFLGLHIMALSPVFAIKESAANFALGFLAFFSRQPTFDAEMSITKETGLNGLFRFDLDKMSLYSAIAAPKSA